VLGHPVDWSGLPDPNGYIAEVLGDTYGRRDSAELAWAHLLGRNAHYFRHAEHNAASLLDLIQAHAVDGRVADPMIAWTQTREQARFEDAAGGPGVYRVVGWTNTATLRATLSRRLDSLNPVAAFLLLELPEIDVLDRSHRDYVVLRCMLDRREESTGLFAGAIWAHDIDFWHNAAPAELEGMFAVDIDAYRARFAGTGVAA
jgi:hypothetical protein